MPSPVRSRPHEQRGPTALEVDPVVGAFREGAAVLGAHAEIDAPAPRLGSGHGGHRAETAKDVATSKWIPHGGQPLWSNCGEAGARGRTTLPGRPGLLSRSADQPLCFVRSTSTHVLPGFVVGGRGLPCTAVISVELRPPRGPCCWYWSERGAGVPGLFFATVGALLREGHSPSSGSERWTPPRRRPGLHATARPALLPFDTHPPVDAPRHGARPRSVFGRGTGVPWRMVRFVMLL